VQKGKVLDCLVYVKRIEANPDKINAIINMKPLRSRKEVQRLTSIIAAMNRFMSKLAERSLTFFAVLRASSSSQWAQNNRQLSMYSKITYRSCPH
jgi:hypothetical protein